MVEANEKLRHILDTICALLLSTKVPTPFWGKATRHAINCIPSLVIPNQTPYESLFESPLDSSFNSCKIHSCTFT